MSNLDAEYRKTPVLDVLAAVLAATPFTAFMAIFAVGAWKIVTLML